MSISPIQQAIHAAHNASRSLFPSNPEETPNLYPSNISRCQEIYCQGYKLLQSLKPEERDAKLSYALRDLKTDLDRRLTEAARRTFAEAIETIGREVGPKQAQVVLQPHSTLREAKEAIEALHRASRVLHPSNAPRPDPSSIQNAYLQIYCDAYLRGNAVLETQEFDPNTRATLRTALKDFKYDLEPVAHYYLTEVPYWKDLAGGTSSSDPTPNATSIIGARQKEVKRHKEEQERLAAAAREFRSNNSYADVYLSPEQSEEGSMSSSSAAAASSSITQSSIGRCQQTVINWESRANNILQEVQTAITKISPIGQQPLDPSKFTKINLQAFCDTYIKAEVVRDEWENPSVSSNPSLRNSADAVINQSDDSSLLGPRQKLAEAAVKANQTWGTLHFAMISLLKAMNPIAKQHDCLREPASGIGSWTRWLSDPFKDAWWFENAAQTAIAERKKETQPQPVEK